MYMTNLVLSSVLESDGLSYSSRIQFILEKNKCSRRVCVKFALFCAEDSLQWIDRSNYQDLYNKCVEVLALTNMWYNDEASVSDAKLRSAARAARAAYDAYNHTSHICIAYSITTAVIYAANAASRATNPAYVITDAINAATYATAATKADTDFAVSQRKYLLYLIELLEGPKILELAI